jgi:hypothetical protein
MILKRGLLAFWALWHALVCFTNLVDILNYLALLDPKWRCASGNWKFLQETTARYQCSLTTNTVLFAGVIAWQGLAAFLFAYAAVSLRAKKGNAARLAYPPFTVSLGLWAAFMIADEVFLAFPVEWTHRGIFTSLLGSLLVIALVPDPSQAGPAEGDESRPPSESAISYSR